MTVAIKAQDVKALRDEAVSGYGENITLSRFARFRIGQSLEVERDGGNS